jgi:tRNA dimethylallyltransferase
MLPPPFHNALVLTGPTGSGKTQFGVDLAIRLDAEIVSMDSMALYRRMDIGTAKPTLEQRSQVPHHLVDVLEPWESANVAWWLREAERVCREIEARGKQVLFVGGTPLYLKALCFGIFEGPPANDAIRQRLTAEADRVGVAELHRQLEAVDPASARKIHPNDLRRVIRALEVHQLTGKPLSAWQTQWTSTDPQTEPPETPAILWLDLPRETLYERIDRRVIEMFNAGLVDEVRQLRSSGKPLSLEATQALGYKEVFTLLDGQTTLEATIAEVQMRSRNFAKRQITWFRHLPGCRPTDRRLTESLWRPKMRS